MNNVKKAMVSMFVAMMMVGLCFGCPSSSKPPDDEIKGIIMTIELGDNIKNTDISGVKFDTFKITNGFFSKDKGGGGESTPYNIEVDYKISYILTKNNIEKRNKIIELRNWDIRSAQERIDDVKGHPLYKENPHYNDGVLGDCKKTIEKAQNAIEEAKNLPDVQEEKKEIIRGNRKLTFVKRGDKWYGGEGWR